MTIRQVESMIDAIRADYRATRDWTSLDAPSDVVVDALRAVPREAFTRPADRSCAYANRPLPIGHGQTISQPFIVALMIDLVRPTPGSVALEIGTGCGYAAAVLAQCVRQVYTIETVRPLAVSASERLADLGAANVSVRLGDGYEGWPEHAPFDAIVVTAAAPHVPGVLTDQLAAPGRMVIPVGRPGGEQTLCLVVRDVESRITDHVVLPVAFVPMVSGRTDPRRDP